MNPEMQFTIIALLNRWGVPPHAYHVHYSPARISIIMADQTVTVTPEKSGYAVNTDQAELKGVPLSAVSHMAAGITAILLTR